MIVQPVKYRLALISSIYMNSLRYQNIFTYFEVSFDWKRGEVGTLIFSLNLKKTKNTTNRQRKTEVICAEKVYIKPHCKR